MDQTMYSPPTSAPSTRFSTPCPQPTPFDVVAVADRLKVFLATAPSVWNPSERIKKFGLPNGESISCVFWQNSYYISGTDIVRSLVFRFHAFGRPVANMKKFEEGVFSDLRNLKPGLDACLEEPRSEFLELLYKNNCIRTQKKQKVFFWFSVPHDRLFMDALERDLKREALGLEPTTLSLKVTPLNLDAGDECSIDDWIHKDALEWESQSQFFPPEQSPDLSRRSSAESAESHESFQFYPHDSYVNSPPLVHSSPLTKMEHAVPQLPFHGDYSHHPYTWHNKAPSSPPQSDDHRRAYLCTFATCTRKFKRYEHLRRHMRCHTGERPYVCPIGECSKTFSRSDNLAQHVKTHGDDTPVLTASTGGEWGYSSPLLYTGADILVKEEEGRTIVGEGVFDQPVGMMAFTV